MMMVNRFSIRWRRFSCLTRPLASALQRRTGRWSIIPQPMVAAFFDIQTQWRVTEVNGALWLGLDYAGVDVALRRGGYDDVDFADLQLMERAAIDAFGGR